MTDELNITSVDPETGDPDGSDAIVRINGRVPGTGDTPWVYDGSGRLRSEDPVDVDELNVRRVRDSTGRHLGRLTGTDDAQTLIDAFADRRSGADVTLPDPGFNLDWDQPVELPKEKGFELRTEGTPTIVPSSDFSSVSYTRPVSGTTADVSAVLWVGGFEPGRSIGSMEVDDMDGVTDWALWLSDFKRSEINPLEVMNSGGIYIEADDSWSNNNRIHHPRIRIPEDWQSGPDSTYTRQWRNGIELSDTGDKTPDQNWIWGPYFDAYDVTASETAIAFIDKGKHNSWEKARVEMATGMLDAYNKNYSISVVNFDRAHTSPVDFTIRENGRACGQIEKLGSADGYIKAQLRDPNTKLTAVEESAATNRAAGPMLDRARQVTTADSINSVGMSDQSSGGSVTINRPYQERCFFLCSTGATAGNTAELAHGDPENGGMSLKISEVTKKTGSMPKLAAGFAPEQTVDESGVVARAGVWESSSDYAEVIYDPGNDLGGHGTSNWWFEVVAGGTSKGSIELQTSSLQRIAIGRKEGQGTTPMWYASSGEGAYETIGDDDAFAWNDPYWRFHVRTTEAADKTWTVGNKVSMQGWAL